VKKKNVKWLGVKKKREKKGSKYMTLRTRTGIENKTLKKEAESSKRNLGRMFEGKNSSNRRAGG